MPRFPCPNCAAERVANDAACVRCRYPQHSRELLIDVADESQPQPFQVSIRFLLFATTAYAVVFAVLARMPRRDLSSMLEVFITFAYFAVLIWRFRKYVEDLSKLMRE